MDRIRKILEVKTNDDFTLECEMENGEVYCYDMSFIKNEKGSMIEPLKNINFLKKAFIECGCITWPNGYNTDGDSVALAGKLIKKTA